MKKFAVKSFLIESLLKMLSVSDIQTDGRTECNVDLEGKEKKDKRIVV